MFIIMSVIVIYACITVLYVTRFAKTRSVAQKFETTSYYNQWIERFVSFRMMCDTCKLTVEITQGEPLNLINP